MRLEHWFFTLPLRLRSLFRRPQVEQELDEELRDHVERKTQQYLAEGLSPEEAHYAALRSMDGLEQRKEECRDARRVDLFHDILQDLRYGLRQLRKSPGFTAVAILSLALGIGANTAIFTLINAVMLQSLPVNNPEELVMLTWDFGGATKSTPDFTRALWEQIRDHQDVFAGLFAYGPTTGTDLSAGGEARPVAVGLVSGDFFSTLRVRPAAGRTLTNADDRPGCPGLAVITHSFWQSEYGGSENVIGKSVAINGEPFQIVGVTEPGFFGLEFGYDVPIWAPRCAGAKLGGAARFMIGRPRTGVTLKQIRARLATLAPVILDATLPANLSAQAAERYRRSTFDVTPFSKGFRLLQNNYGEALLILMAVVSVVLLIACANLANLLLARATARRREIAMRIALGASRPRLIRQLLTESLLLSLIGAGVGALFAIWGSHALVAFLSTPRQLISLDLSPDAGVLVFTLAIGILTAVLFGLAPAWRAVHVEPHAAMRQCGRGVVVGFSRFSLGKALVVAQIALSLIAIVGAGLLLGSWRRLVQLDPGFRSDGVLLAAVNVPAARVPDDRLVVTCSSILELLRAIPGVGAASATARTPISPVNWKTVIDVMDYAPAPGENLAVQLNEVSDGYFATMRIPVLVGRDFNGSDTPASPRVAIVSQELARKFAGGTAAIGRRIRTQYFYGMRFDPPVEIIGIVGNTKQSTLDEAVQPIVYLALSQNPKPVLFSFALRSERSLAEIGPSVKGAIAEIAPRLPVELTTMNQQLDESLRLPRTLGMLSGFFGALALLLASIGLYGIVAYAVTRRTNEIGIRVALGAQRSNILAMVLKDTLLLVCVGVAIGIPAAVGASRLISNMLFDLSPTDPAVLMTATLVLSAAAALAGLIPARRASRVDPMVALRYE